MVDNASTDGSASYIAAEYPEFVFISNNKNTGFGRANNQLIPLVESDYILLLNTDAFVQPDTIAKTLRYMEDNPTCGVLGVRLLSEDGSLQPSCRYFPTPLNTFLARNGLGRLAPWVRPADDLTWDHRGERECDWVPGCYYLVRKKVIDTLGLFDPRYFLYYEEVDHCRRVKAAGWKVIYFGDCSATHIGGESAKTVGSVANSGRQLTALQIESELLYFRKHHGLQGLIAHLALTALGDILRAIKHFARRNFNSSSLLFETRQFWRIARLTDFGQKPTR